MRYMGSKSKIANKIVPFITAHEGDLYIEPFLGSGAVFAKVAPQYPKAIGSDANPDLMLLWKAVADGWMPPMVLTKDKYLALRADPNPSPERSYAGFACSYGGSWFGGYIEDRWTTTAKGKKANPALKARASVVQMGRFLSRFQVETCDYAAHTPLMRPGVVVYCDPPYRGTQGYDGMEKRAGIFDHERFWRTMGYWTELGATVLVSEYDAPEDWKPAWSEKKVAWGGGTKRVDSIEAVWTRVA